MINIDPNTRFRDVARREAVAVDSHVNTIARLKKVQEKRALSRAEAEELALSEEILEEISKSQRNNSKVDEVCDPLFVATRTLLNEQSLIDDELRSHLTASWSSKPVASRTSPTRRWPHRTCRSPWSR